MGRGGTDLGGLGPAETEGAGADTGATNPRREREARGEKLRALGQMASGVAHDLNQYLGLVAGYGDLTMRALSGPS